MRTWHIVTYDVRDDRRLRQVGRVIGGYGDRIQYSVFRCRMTVTERERLRWELEQVMNEDDSLLIVPPCERCAAGITGLHAQKGWEDETPPFVVV